MIKYFRAALAVFAVVSFLLSGCTNSSKFEKDNPGQSTLNAPAPSPVVQNTSAPAPEATPAKDGSSSPPKDSTGNTSTQIDLQKVKPNEAGKVMVVMFHNFVEAYKSGDKAYTTTFDEFRKLLQTLYDGGYRLVNLNDYINNNISVPAGCIPMVFTFDDGTAGQFNLIEENGKLTAGRQTAVGIMEEFNKTHPDFGLKGTFFVNLGLGTFQGKGTVAERLKYLVDKGFEIGNHTLTHVNLKQVTTVDKIQKEIGENQKKMYELIPDYKFTSFSLPFGAPSKDLQDYVVKGEFEGVKYENTAIVEVGWDPNVSPISKKFNPLSIHRVRSSGIVPVDADLAWWLKKLSKAEQYVSDGNPDTVTVPKTKEENVDKEKLKGKQLILY